MYAQNGEEVLLLQGNNLEWNLSWHECIHSQDFVMI